MTKTFTLTGIFIVFYLNLIAQPSCNVKISFALIKDNNVLNQEIDKKAIDLEPKNYTYRHKDGIHEFELHQIGFCNFELGFTIYGYEKSIALSLNQRSNDKILIGPIPIVNKNQTFRFEFDNTIKSLSNNVEDLKLNNSTILKEWGGFKNVTLYLIRNRIAFRPKILSPANTDRYFFNYKEVNSNDKVFKIDTDHLKYLEQYSYHYWSFFDYGHAYLIKFSEETLLDKPFLVINYGELSAEPKSNINNYRIKEFCRQNDLKIKSSSFLNKRFYQLTISKPHNLINTIKAIEDSNLFEYASPNFWYEYEKKTNINAHINNELIKKVDSIGFSFVNGNSSQKHRYFCTISRNNIKVSSLDDSKNIIIKSLEEKISTLTLDYINHILDVLPETLFEKSGKPSKKNKKLADYNDLDAQFQIFLSNGNILDVNYRTLSNSLKKYTINYFDKLRLIQKIFGNAIDK